MYIEIFIVAAIIAFIYFYRKNTGDNSYKFLADHLDLQACLFLYHLIENSNNPYL